MRVGQTDGRTDGTGYDSTLWPEWARGKNVWLIMLSLCVYVMNPSIPSPVHSGKKFGEIFTGSSFKLLLSFMVISDVYRSFLRNKTIFIKFCLTQWISKLPGSFEIHWVRQYLVNFMGLPGNSALSHQLFSQIQYVLPIKHMKNMYEYIFYI